MKNLLIFCIAQGIDELIVSRFIDFSRRSSKMDFDIHLEKGSGEKDPLFNKSKLLNIVLKKNIPEYKVILQTDIDLIFPPNMIDEIYNQVVKNLSKDVFYHSRLRRCGLTEIQDIQYENFPWNEWKSRNSILCTGCWNMASSRIWRKSKGYNEDMYGWGAEDDDLYKRVAASKVEWKILKNYPLIHVNHPPRTIKRSKENVVIMKKGNNKDWLK